MECFSLSSLLECFSLSSLIYIWLVNIKKNLYMVCYMVARLLLLGTGWSLLSCCCSQWLWRYALFIFLSCHVSSFIRKIFCVVVAIWLSCSFIYPICFLLWSVDIIDACALLPTWERPICSFVISLPCCISLGVCPPFLFLCRWHWSVWGLHVIDLLTLLH